MFRTEIINVYEDYIFEMNCAEEVGYYKMADAIQNALIKIASSDYKSIRKKIQKEIDKNSDLKSVEYLKVQNAFSVQAKPTLSKKTKSKLKELAGDIKIKYNYS